MLENFGARLRQRRVEQGIPLNTIAQQTKINLSLLEGLERDDVSRWPSGIFRRAYIRAYAQAIGLDPDVVVREFLVVHPEPEEVFNAALETALASDRARANTSTPARLRDIVGSALDSLSVLWRVPAVENRAPAAAAHIDRHDVIDDDHVVVTYSAPPQPAWAETADDAGVEAPVARASKMPQEFYGAAETPPAFSIASEAEEEAAAVEPSAVLGDAEQPHANATRMKDPVPSYPDLLALARLCTDFGRVADAEALPRLLQQAAKLVDAAGLIVWIWDDSMDGLRPSLGCGYSDRVLAQLPTVKRDDDNATAAAFRSAETCTIEGREHVSGALAVPVITAEGCAGVLAIELQPGAEPSEAVRAVAAIVAASLAPLVPRNAAAETEAGPELTTPAADDMSPPVARTRFAY